MTTDKMRAEFEKWAEDNDCGITLAATTATGYYTRNIAWTAYQAAYAAGQKAEREAIAAEVDEFFNRHHDWRCKLAGVAIVARIRNKPEGER
jgi:hypothetical protein